MVFFVCEGCNETLKKSKVDAHAGRCRNCWAVSCVDCSVVFEGNDYAAHTSCISEAEKYEKTLCPSQKDKKQTPYERWMGVVQSAKCVEDPTVQDVLTHIAGYANVPRKKHKFINFVTNSLALRDTKLVEKAWSIYETSFNALRQEDSATATIEGASIQKKRSSEETTEVPAKKKRKTAEESVKWIQLIKRALKSAGKEMEMRALRQTLFKQIQAQKLSTMTGKELKKRFKAAITESEKFAVVEVVRLT
ncbi:hypothetical protein CCR75_003455 [Bremia lactucae]|uniref:Zinc finger C2H2 LYAR-type domain-containing protein n=1 Tax=Bremia lactucae TaxID=4779 RepID=A0A976FJQ3_BRELC|nr:hypothetical protein CCR75_003455 [Bremia lactucae]